MPRASFDSFSVYVPRGWVDVTASVAAENPPHTLAHRNGVGALQFSIALYQSGQVPSPTPSELLRVVEEFGRKRGFGEPVHLVCETGPPRLAAGSFDWGEDYLRVWQISDGRNFAFITYTCASDQVGPEVGACERIVRSITFANGND